MKSWKTGLSGLLAILTQLLHYFYPNIITEEVANTITGVLVSAGLIAAKDSDVTGGKRVQGDGNVMQSTNPGDDKPRPPKP